MLLAAIGILALWIVSVLVSIVLFVLVAVAVLWWISPGR
jgi:hypothetical protein